MGEYADMMLDGILCEGCGSYIDDAGGEGFPRYCSNQCARDRGALHALPNCVAKPNPAKVNCPTCRKRVKQIGLSDHMRAAHPEVTMTKFVAVKFKDTDTRTYTYAWDGDELYPGDRVKVPDNRSDGWKRVTVVSVSDEAPPFACKPILGRVEDVADPADLGELGAAAPDTSVDTDVIPF
ncbi:hypothetical protein EIK56_17925 [Sphingomonas sp. C8-2]|nr:hypothetical protein EIK56_17925 [Sphingomonas sp. C8-2]